MDSRGKHIIRSLLATAFAVTALAGCLQVSLVGSSSSSNESTQPFFGFSPLPGVGGRWVDAGGNFFIADSGNCNVRLVFAGNGTISTVAGLTAPLDHYYLSPASVALDSSGNIYMADNGANIIRKLVAGTDIVTTVAGTPTWAGGYSGDGGPATGAQLYNPTSIAWDSAGNLYIADTYNHVIREVSAATGIITTIAGNHSPGFSGDGGLATSAQLYNPMGIVLDSSNNLYIADDANQVIREVNASTGIITTIAGTPSSNGYSGDGGLATSAQLYFPIGLALDHSNHLFIADSTNYAIREVNLSTGIITTVAGIPTSSGYSGDGGAATGAQLGSPQGVALDSSSNLYIADTGNSIVRKVDASTGIITTVAGTPGISGNSGNGGPATSALFKSPSGVVVDSSNNLFIADDYTAVREVNAANGIISNVVGFVAGYSGDGGSATNAELNYPMDDALDSAGNLYIVDTFNFIIRKVNATTGIITTVAGTPGSSGSSGDGGPATGAQFVSPQGIALDSSNNLYIVDNSAVREVNSTTGIITTIAGTPGSSGYSGDGGAATSAQLAPQGIALDSSNNLYIADVSNSIIRKVNATTGIITTVAGTPGSAGFSGDGGAATGAQLNNPVDIAVDSSNNLYIADAGNSIIREVNAITGIITTIAGTQGFPGYSGDGGPATGAELNDITAVAVDASGNFYIPDYKDNVIREVNAATGIITTVAGNGTGFGSGLNAGYSGDGGPATSAQLSSPFVTTLFGWTIP